MTVSKINFKDNNIDYICLSTDTKPVNAEPNSILYEADTGVYYITNGSSWYTWVNNHVQVTGRKASEYEAVTVDNTAGGVGLTAAKYGTCRHAYITAETAQMRFTIDGTAPTTTAGHLLDPGDILELDSNEDIAAFKAIRTGSISGVLQCTYSD